MDTSFTVTEPVSHRVRPTVCTNRPLDVIGACLTAVKEAGLAGDTIVVLSGLSPELVGERRREITSLVPGALILEEPVGGLSRARNLAVSVASPSDVVAFLDDDAVIGPQWLSAMITAWAEAGPRVGAVGGPVKPLFLAPRPRWLSDELLGGLSIIDHGPDPRILEGRFLYGANLAVLAEQADAVGGFDPERGPLGRGPGFGDDVDIQLRMREAGLQVLYVPEIDVAHRIPAERLRRRALLERRYAHGFEIARTSEVPLVLSSVRGVLTNVVRWAVQTVAGRPDLAMDHLAFAAQSVGVLRALASARKPE